MSFKYDFFHSFGSHDNAARVLDPANYFTLGWRSSVVLAVACLIANAQENPLLNEAESLILKGNYEDALPVIQSGYGKRADRPRFATLEIRALLAVGNYEEAIARGTFQGRRSPYDYQLNLELARALLSVGDTQRGNAILNNLAETIPNEAVASRVAYGELLLELKRDPKGVLENYLEPAKAANAGDREVYLALGRLGLANHDRELAAENFREGLKRFPDDAEFLLGLAEAGASPPPAGGVPPQPGEKPEKPPGYLDFALNANPRSTAALLAKARKLTSGKNFDDAEKTLDQLFAVNPRHPQGWALKAAIGYLREDSKAAAAALLKAREIWPANPEISEIIGTNLADHYRFAEGIDFLEDALRKDPESTSIRFELGSNLLRFGRIDEGWKLIEAVHEADPYHVAAFNLITLRDRLKDFPIIERDGVKVRMSPEDAAVFGEHAADFALKAKQTLAAKYGVTLSQPVMVEILPTQEDFAIRTFGLPGGESFLGVCFGPLITMTSPRGRLGRNNWEAVLWHEMAHTITLEASRNRIPRWFTEGISVFEERQTGKGWGLRMNSKFRERFLAGKFPSIAELDEAFGSEDIMLAYYESSCVIEHLHDRFGMEKIRAALADLAAGIPLARSFGNHGIPMAELEKSFDEAIKAAARAYGKNFDWKPLSDEEYRDYRTDPVKWVTAHPERYAASMLLISKWTKEGKWSEAKTVLERVIAAEPDNREEFNPYEQLAIVCRNLNDPVGERAAWEKLLALNADSAEAATHLLDFEARQPTAERTAISESLLAINPLSETAYRAIAAASSSTDRTRAAYSSLLAIKPVDASNLHYELATMLRETQPDEARLHVLKALEDNPRFQKALELLVLFPPRQ